MDEFHRKAAVTALKNMFEEKNYFDICTVDKILKLTGCIPDKKDHQALSALHCVHWNEMDADLRNMVMLKTMQMFETPGFDTELLDGAIKANTLLLN